MDEAPTRNIRAINLSDRTKLGIAGVLAMFVSAFGGALLANAINGGDESAGGPPHLGVFAGGPGAAGSGFHQEMPGGAPGMPQGPGGLPQGAPGVPQGPGGIPQGRGGVTPPGLPPIPDQDGYPNGGNGGAGGSSGGSGNSSNGGGSGSKGTNN